MKNKFIKIGLPIICALPIAIGGGIAIDSYIQDSVGYLTDLEGWEPTIDPYEPEGIAFNNRTANIAYCEAVKANPQIYVEDWYYIVTEQVRDEMHNLERRFGRDNVTYDFKMRARDVSIDSKEYTSMSGTNTYYLLSGDLDVRVDAKFQNNEILPESGYETLYIRRRMSNCEFSCARDGSQGGKWHIGVHHGFFGPDLPWHYECSYDYKWVFHLETKIGEGTKVNEDKEEQHVYANNYTVSGANIPYFATRYFENAPYALTAEMRMIADTPNPEDYGMEWPIINNDVVELDKDYITTISYQDDPNVLTGFDIPFVRINNTTYQKGIDFTWDPGEREEGIDQVGTLTLPKKDLFMFPYDVYLLFQYAS